MLDQERVNPAGERLVEPITALLPHTPALDPAVPLVIEEDTARLGEMAWIVPS